ncbi:MAG TPA: S49 family peptidase [Thiohalobacter sp.]|nr:S49 family peptidase [Thiohalobacter sp.]
MADSLAASAAYLVGSAAREFSVTRTGYAGSIGVVWRHVDFSRAMEQDGIGITQLYAGARKTAGNPFEPLPDDVRSEFQTDVDALYGMFVDAVAGYRRMPAQRLRDTEARVYMGRDTVAIGLADKVETADEMLARLSDQQHGAPDTHKYASAAPAAHRTIHPAAQAASSTAELKQITSSAYAHGLAAGRRAERERLHGILQSDAACGREALARHCAFDACMTVEDSLRLLSSAPQASSRPLGRLDAAMAAIPQPNIGPDSAEAEMTDPKRQRSLVSAIAAGAAMSSFNRRR